VTALPAQAAVAGIATSQPASHQSNPKGSTPERAQLAAWTVTSRGGTVTVSIRKMIDVAALQAKLRAAGIPASVSTSGNAACTSYPASIAQLNAALGIQGVGKAELGGRIHSGVTECVFRRSALPSGAGVELVQPSHDILFRLVRVSPQCTGS
jgi:hypothetical protein